MKKSILLSALLLATLSACAVGTQPSRSPSDEVLIAQEDAKVRSAVVQTVQSVPTLGLPSAFALVSAAKGLTELKYFVYTGDSCSVTACPDASPAVERQERYRAEGGDKTDKYANPAGTGSVIDGPRPPADQRKAQITLPGPVDK